MRGENWAGITASLSDGGGQSLAAYSLSGARLLVGVMSFRSPVGLSRRRELRQSLRLTPAAAVRFVLSNSTPDEDAATPDMLLLDVAESGRTLGTYLLTNAFFRHALKLQPSIAFVGRADDDGFFDPPTVLAELEASGLGPSIVYGPFHEWGQWLPTSMVTACFAYAAPSSL